MPSAVLPSIVEIYRQDCTGRRQAPRSGSDTLMVAASTNEERFIVSCESVGEADVRNKLSAGRYTGRRSEWAANWLERIESGKSDATRAEEKSSRSLKTADRPSYALPVILGTLLLVAAILVGAFTFL